MHSCGTTASACSAYLTQGCCPWLRKSGLTDIRAWWRTWARRCAARAKVINLVELQAKSQTDAGPVVAQSGLADIRAWVAYMGAAWCGEVAEAEAALAHSSQAVRYLLTGKDDCVRKATKACPRLCLRFYDLAVPRQCAFWESLGGLCDLALIRAEQISSINRALKSRAGHCLHFCVLPVPRSPETWQRLTGGCFVGMLLRQGARGAQGFDITPDLRRMCPALSLQQVYKLTEHHHDDWITGSQTTDTLVLLQTLKRIVDATVRPPPCTPLLRKGSSHENDTPVI